MKTHIFWKILEIIKFNYFTLLIEKYKLITLSVKNAKPQEFMAL